MTIDILCKVIDNYGDIGVAWRLARALSECPDAPCVRLVVDDLGSFAAIESGVDPSSAYQIARGVEVVSWNGPLPPEAAASYRARPPRAIVECFACGRPPWLEEMIFAPDARPSSIVDLEHLTAESYARELHLAPSLTRSSFVRKSMFMPGFEEGTGGLIMDASFKRTLNRVATASGRAELRRELAAGLGLMSGSEDSFWILIFSYERDYSRIVADLAAFAAKARPVLAVGGPDGTATSAPTGTSRRPLLVLAAAGASHDCFMAAWERAGRPFPAIALPFLSQENWDRILAASDFSIVRGEDSWARAALAGKPFLWQAYPQADRYQMVKVEAFLRRLQRHFQPADFGPIARAYRAINDRDQDGPSVAGDEELGPILEAHKSAAAGFAALGADLAARTDLASALLTFFRETV